MLTQRQEGRTALVEGPSILKGLHVILSCLCLISYDRVNYFF